MPYPAIAVDAHWNVVLANAAWAALYGGELVGTNIFRRWFADPAASAATIVN
jgi:hypothetical protein